jgi:hypothetical protein
MRTQETFGGNMPLPTYKDLPADFKLILNLLLLLFALTDSAMAPRRRTGGIPGNAY